MKKRFVSLLVAACMIFALLPVSAITAFAKENSIIKIVLFGSRARGDHTERSDVDLAVYGGDFDSFYWNIKENIHSLLSFDVVDMNSRVTEELKKEIERDGVVIYEKTR